MEYTQTNKTYAQLGMGHTIGQVDYAQGAKLNQIKRDDTASGTMERMDSQVSHLAELCIRLETIADRIDGPAAGVPAGAGTQVMPTRPPHFVGSLNYITSRFGDKLGELTRSLSRIESALG